MPLQRTDLIPSKTYADEANLERAIRKKLGNVSETVRYHVAWTKDGRCYPILCGASALRFALAGGFCIIGG